MIGSRPRSWVRIEMVLGLQSGSRLGWVSRLGLRSGVESLVDVSSLGWVLEDQLSNCKLEEDGSEQESEHPSVEYVASVNSSNAQLEGVGGKPGILSFYNHPYRREEKILVSATAKNQNILLWFVGPTVLVASFIFPLRRILSTIFEDSLLTDFLILFFTEAIFYCEAAVFLHLIDCLRRPLELVSSDRRITSPLGYRISSISVLVLSLIIPMVTMGFVWPWTGPAVSATLAPYLVGIVVQFAFEQYARYIDSPSCSGGATCNSEGSSKPPSSENYTIFI
ncbi:hypothetical protein BC332_02960 [Capsicum chinense]|nr:hypothetical protein BC332_02960 [Capsicum chinense]